MFDVQRELGLGEFKGKEKTTNGPNDFSSSRSTFVVVVCLYVFLGLGVGLDFNDQRTEGVEEKENKGLTMEEGNLSWRSF